jgi:RNA polymerase sigma-70 factor, ECF subfamily
MERPERFVRAARKGDEPAFSRLFDDLHLPLFRFAFRLTRSVADAEDIVQECFLSLLRPDSGYNPTRTPVRTYLFGAVRNLAVKRFRQTEGFNGEAEDLVDQRTPETEASRSELESLVARAVALLPGTQQEVLILAHYEQLPLTMIADILETEVTAVKSRLQRARTTLKVTLAAYAPCARRGAKMEQQP